MSAQHQIDLFTAGLGQPLASDVELQKLANLQVAMSLARSHERAREAALAVTQSSGRVATKGRLPPATPTAVPSAAPSATTGVPQGGAPRHRFKRLSPEELAEKRRNQECYFCTEKYSSDHKCANKGGVYSLLAGDGRRRGAGTS